MTAPLDAQDGALVARGVAVMLPGDGESTGKSY